MVLFRFLFAPVLLAVAVLSSPDRGGPSQRRPAAIEPARAPAARAGVPTPPHAPVRAGRTRPAAVP